MAYRISDTVFDEALNYLKNNCTRVVLLDADPGSSYSDATTANGSGSGMNLASVTVSSTNFTLADRTGGGRKVTVDAQNSVSVTTSGDASHIAWLDVSNTAVLFTTELTTVRTGLVGGSDTVDIPAHFAAILDAVVAS